VNVKRVERLACGRYRVWHDAALGPETWSEGDWRRWCGLHVEEGLPVPPPDSLAPEPPAAAAARPVRFGGPFGWLAEAFDGFCRRH